MNRMCEFRLSNTGPGNDAEQIGNILDWQGTQSDSAGAGVGLYIAQGMVKANGRTLQSHNAPGAGATFAFTLPLAWPFVPEAPA